MLKPRRVSLLGTGGRRSLDYSGGGSPAAVLERPIDEALSQLADEAPSGDTGNMTTVDLMAARRRLEGLFLQCGE